ncbi:PIN domain-like protein [Myriangium duriaei CBS 260.36]|uniref:PIN domain-like protein n=1 Tax=Myriangium duriaei CBS 260.36 TaxID=1168546 RepID=A0A9P4J477_9PEZI|nr:PIN domain-like protein [Myriangium duriaei CBS 260.36]
MGVTGLWTVVQPCARPTKLETLNKKRLAVDASIWIYQFLKAVRDKEGNALRNSHVVGFFRRICKLLFIGIQPVFVFDGGAPALKRQTINSRKRRREGRKEDAVRTAGKLLALQMQRAAEEEDEKRKREQARPPPQEEEILDTDNLVYVEELQMTQQERAQNRKFKKKDQYHLPELETNLAEMGGVNDPRIMSLDELQAYARQFDTGEDINVYDFSKIDFDSPFFTSLPASDRYNILNAARLRSRLRMGYSKDQLDKMFPNRMEFSKFQIERVAERNELTQRLMNLNGMNDDGMWGVNGTGRIAGERGREYVLVRNDGVEGGWALGVVSGRDEGQQDKPIDVDEIARRELQEAEEEDEQSEEDFEDVPIEGLNRLPKPASNGLVKPPQSDATRRRREFYASRKPRKSRPARRDRAQTTDANAQDSLFVADDESEGSDEEVVEDHLEAEEDDDLQRAIAMSMQQDGDEETTQSQEDQPDREGYLKPFQQKRVDDAPSIKDSQGKSAAAIARTVNARAARMPTSTLFQADSDDEAEPNRTKSGSQSPYYDKPTEGVRKSKDQQRATRVQASVTEASRQKPKSTGPLPFEKLDLGSSIFGKKVEKFQENTAGGFERDGEKKEENRPLPPWFVGNPDTDMEAQKVIEKADRDRARQFENEQQFQFSEPSVLQRKQSKDVIDLDEPEQQSQPKEILIVDDDADVDVDVDPDALSQRPAIEIEDDEERSTGQEASQADEITMGDVAEELKLAPPAVPSPPGNSLPQVLNDQSRDVIAKEQADLAQEILQSPKKADDSDEEIDWSASEDKGAPVSRAIDAAIQTAPENPEKVVLSRSASPAFEDVPIPDQPDYEAERRKGLETQIQAQTSTADHVTGTADENLPAENAEDEDYGLLSDSEDEDLMRQLEIEAQEHARFAAELNQKTQQQNIADYERELKQLRTQQKKDRRDADEVTQIMITECQQLLRLFGLPYITAPMEAEAQCAELVKLGLVDGIVTDDSDCFLFGGTRIYKNMFNQAKFVECYLLPDLEKEFDLTRAKLIGIAQLLGSDYTEGLVGVGPVTALEILSEFPDLSAFKTWWTGVQEGRVSKTDDLPHPFRRKFRKTNASKLFLPTAFPDPRVELAYLEPEVDSDPSQFQWGVPDLDALRSFLMATIGWSQERTDEVLVPVIRDMNRRQQEGTQSNITKFFTGTTGTGVYAPRVRAAEASKRLGGALGRMADRARRKRAGGVGEAEPEAEVEEGEQEVQEEEEEVPAGKKRQTRKRKSAAREDGDGDEDREFEEAQPKKTRAKRGGGRKKKAIANDEDDE